MKVAIEAGANSGKTTQCELLAKAGFLVAKEQATEIMTRGGPKPWADYDLFHLRMLERQLRVNAKLKRLMDRLGVHGFTDRDVLTGVPYRLVFGLPVPDFLQRLLTRKFADVCVLLEPVPNFCYDGIRYDGPDLPRALFPVYRRVCEKAGVPVVVQPFVEDPQVRNRMMLEKLGIKPRCVSAKFPQLAA